MAGKRKRKARSSRTEAFREPSPQQQVEMSVESTARTILMNHPTVRTLEKSIKSRLLKDAKKVMRGSVLRKARSA